MKGKKNPIVVRIRDDQTVDQALQQSRFDHGSSESSRDVGTRGIPFAQVRRENWSRDNGTWILHNGRYVFNHPHNDWWQEELDKCTFECRICHQRFSRRGMGIYQRRIRKMLNFVSQCNLPRYGINVINVRLLPQNIVIKCELCGIVTNGHIQMRQHLDGKDHKKRLLQLRM